MLDKFGLFIWFGLFIAAVFGVRWIYRSMNSDSRLITNSVARDHVPSELIPLVPMVEKWGAINSDSERYAFADSAESDPDALKELERFNDSFTPELQRIYDDWVDREPMTKNETVARFYFTLLLLHELGFRLPRKENVDPVPELIEQLKETGSERKDSSRMWAARQLPDYGDNARRAIPDLEAATHDPLAKVRIWAHCALARIMGDEMRHREAIRQIGRDDRSEETEMEVEGAFEVLARTEEQHNIEALRGFCIMNEVNELERLAPITAIDDVDQHGQRALQYAVGNRSIDAVRILLEHGADPNLKTRNGDTYLHIAACWRDNQEIIKLLVEHGAEVNAKDDDGLTPLDHAIELRRRSNIEVITQLGGVNGRL